MLYKALPFEIKSVSDSGEFEGYAAAFNNLDRTGDIILPGAFKDTIPAFLKDGIIAWQHDWTEPIGKPTHAEEDKKGLFIKGTLSDTARGRDARTLMKDGVVKKMSIGYQTKDWAPHTDESLRSILGSSYSEYDASDLASALDWGRILKRLDLYEASPVSVPANNQADITRVKSASAMTEREFEQVLREAGCSRKDAQIIISKGFKALLRDAEPAPADPGSNAADLSAAVNQLYAKHLAREARFLGVVVP